MSGARAGLRIGVSTGHLMALLVALGGLFAMHGMSDHGLGGPSEMPATSSMAAAIGSTAAPSLTPHEARAYGLAHPVPAPGHGHDMELTGLCLAVLAAALLTLAGILRWRHRAPPSWLPTRDVGLALVTTRPRPKPPDLLALSIQRC